MRDHCPSPLLYMAAIMILLMIPHAEDVLIFLGGMVGGEAHLLDMSLGEESPYFFCTTCPKGSMRNYMATIAYHLFLYDVDYRFGWSTWGMPLMSNWEEIFYESPSWKVIHFIWMIAWRGETFIDDEIPHDCHHFYLEKAMDQQEGFHNNLPFFHDESHWVYSPKANLHTWEEPLGDGILQKF